MIWYGAVRKDTQPSPVRFMFVLATKPRSMNGIMFYCKSDWHFAVPLGI